MAYVRGKVRFPRACFLKASLQPVSNVPVAGKVYILTVRIGTTLVKAESELGCSFIFMYIFGYFLKGMYMNMNDTQDQCLDSHIKEKNNVAYS